MDTEDIFMGLGVEIKIDQEEDFLVIKETLTRIGVSSRKENKLFQSCHILHKRGRYSILHFKELFILDGLESSISESDVGRRNLIAKLLEEWDLCDIINPNDIIDPLANMGQIKIISHKNKNEWELVPKYHIGK